MEDNSDSIDQLHNKKSLSLANKIDLIIEYCSKFGSKIDGATVYKGYNIGKFAISIRSNVKKGKCFLTDEQTAKLKEYGILDSVLDNIDDKVKRVERFVKKHPSIWHNRENIDLYLETISDEDERKRIKEEFDLAISSYDYIMNRVYRKKLSIEHYERLKKAGVGGRFGYQADMSSRINSIIKKYGISKRAADKIIKIYGDIDIFRKKYLKCLIDNDFHEIPKEIMDNEMLVCDFDLSSPDFICRNDGYISLYKDLFGLEGKSIIINKKEIAEKVDECLSKIPKRYKFIIEKRYGFYGETPQRLDEIGEELKISRQTAYELKKKTLKKLKSELKGCNFYSLSIVSREEFVRKFFSQKEIFYKDKPDELDDDLKYDLTEIVILDLIRNDCGILYNDFVNEYFYNRKMYYINESKHEIAIAIMRKKASNLFKRMKTSIENCDMLDDISKEKIYNRIFQSSEYLRIMIEANIECNDNQTENDSFTNYFAEIEKYIRQITDNNKKKAELLTALNCRKKGIIDENKEKIISLIRNKNNIENSKLRKKKKLELEIQDLDLSFRIKKALAAEGIRTVSDWTRKSFEEKKAIKNLGRKSLAEIEEKIGVLSFCPIDFDTRDDNEIESSNLKDEILNKINSLYLDEKTRKDLMDIFNSKFNGSRDGKINENLQQVFVDSFSEETEDDYEEEDFNKILEEKIEELKKSYKEKIEQLKILNEKKSEKGKE